MPKLKPGDLIKDNTGDTYKILEVWGNILFISCTYNHKSYGFTTNEEWLKERGYTWDTPTWEPSKSQKYWCISSVGEAICDFWNDTAADQARRDLLGIYETEELAQAALLEIRRKLGK